MNPNLAWERLFIFQYLIRARQEITWAIPVANVPQIQFVLCPRNRSVACYERISKTCKEESYENNTQDGGKKKSTESYRIS